MKGKGTRSAAIVSPLGKDSRHDPRAARQSQCEKRGCFRRARRPLTEVLAGGAKIDQPLGPAPWRRREHRIALVSKRKAPVDGLFDVNDRSPMTNDRSPMTNGQCRTRRLIDRQSSFITHESLGIRSRSTLLILPAPSILASESPTRTSARLSSLFRTGSYSRGCEWPGDRLCGCSGP